MFERFDDEQLRILSQSLLIRSVDLTNRIKTLSYVVLTSSMRKELRETDILYTQVAREKNNRAKKRGV